MGNLPTPEEERASLDQSWAGISRRIAELDESLAAASRIVQALTSRQSDRSWWPLWVLVGVAAVALGFAAAIAVMGCLR